ncbi:MAG TPA: glycosyltransferase family 39 protein [Pseudobacteroides sp.]|uniref:glycosyltransferase family 39 protein n=1 Tax=Pseudobacteroides sp. TaxID=1968840 RepID=UPI002F958908
MKASKLFSRQNIFLFLIISISLIIKLYLIFTYKNRLTLSSDDLNYIKSAVALIRSGIFTFHNYNEPTVFVMPLYPLFLAAFFKVLGYGILGLQAVRVAQAIISCASILIIFLTTKKLFNTKAAFIASFFYAFYIPNIITTGYFLTETLFAFLLISLIYLSIVFAEAPSKIKFAGLGLLYTIATLCRPTLAFFPVFLLIYCLLKKIKFKNLIAPFIAFSFIFILFMTPWWVRNYKEYGEFIPLSAASGNPMLQGTYVDYKQTPENTVYYKLGKTAFETNKIEIDVAKTRMKNEFKKDFWGYLNWYTVKKTIFLWYSAFYWKPFWGINTVFVVGTHYILLLGIPVLIYCLFKNFRHHFLTASIIIYFNIAHCYYMTFDRYAFPLLTILSVYSAYFFSGIFEKNKLKY